jgi:hypothetical protein
MVLLLRGIVASTKPTRVAPSTKGASAANSTSLDLSDSDIICSSSGSGSGQKRQIDVEGVIRALHGCGGDEPLDVDSLLGVLHGEARIPRDAFGEKRNSKKPKAAADSDEYLKQLSNKMSSLDQLLNRFDDPIDAWALGIAAQMKSFSDVDCAYAQFIVNQLVFDVGKKSMVKRHPELQPIVDAVTASGPWASVPKTSKPDD